MMNEIQTRSKFYSEEKNSERSINDQHNNQMEDYGDDDE